MQLYVNIFFLFICYLLIKFIAIRSKWVVYNKKYPKVNQAFSLIVFFLKI